MAKARKAAPRRGASRQQSSAKRSIPGWLWLVAGLAIGVFVTFLFQLEPGRGSVQRDKTPPAPVVKPPPTRADQPRYDFYTLLPESEVIVPQSSVPEIAVEPAKSSDEPKPPVASAASGTRFYLQAGSFRQRAEADRVRAQILLLGLDVRLENARLDGGEIWYRVQVGPFQDRTTLSSAQSTLAGNGFENLLLQQRTGP